MSGSVIGISTQRVSGQFVREQLIRQFGFNQAEMYRLETAISTGRQYQAPSENPTSALQVIGIQSLLQRKDQLKANINTSQTYLKQTDSALSSVSGVLASVRSAALSAIGATASEAQRQAVIQQTDQAVQQMITLGNQQINGRQLFGGTVTTGMPFSMDSSGNIVYSGNGDPVQSYADLNQLFAASVTGSEAFGSLSKPVEGAALTVAVSYDTRLSDLNGGQGVAAGRIAVSDGYTTNIVDLAAASTLGDVAMLIHQNPPTGRTVNVDVTSSGLTIRLLPDAMHPAGDNLSIQEVNDNRTARDLGIFNAAGVGPGPLVGEPLNAAISPTTQLDDLFGSRARAYIRFSEANSDILLEANSTGAQTTTGTDLNDVAVQFVADAPAAGQETAVFAAGPPGTLTVHISTSAVSASRAEQIVSAINKAAGLPFTARLDPADQDGGGQPSIAALPASTTTAGGAGVRFDTSGLQIASAGRISTVDLRGAGTVQDVLNGINNSDAGLIAEINAARSGIEIRSRVSGADFSIGENGGATAAQLGIRTFTADTRLAQLNHGLGVGRHPAGGKDFTITETIANPLPATIQVDISIPGAATIGDVIQSINTAAQAAGATFRAQLAATGNGIELVDTDPTAGPIVVTAESQSTAAVDLGLIPVGGASAHSIGAAAASSTIDSGPNSALLFEAVDPGLAGNVAVSIEQDPAVTQGNETVSYDAVLKTLTFRVSSQSNANDVIAALQNDPVAGVYFTATLDTAHDPTNDGTGIVQPQAVQMTGGREVALTGRDVNPLETDSIFNALLRLSAALKSNDNAGIQRAVDLLNASTLDLSSTRAELGVRQQSLDTIGQQIDNEELNLKAAMSNMYDTDMADAISQFTAAQIAYQATLQATGSLLKMTLLDYL